MNIIEFICESLCIDNYELMAFASTAPHRYKIYDIPKRSGKGFRTIAHPSKQLKYIQRLILRKLAEVLKVHECAFAYQKSLSIKDNAKVHQNSRYLLKMDFKDFFPSITPELLFKEFTRAGVNISSVDRDFIAHILFFKIRKKSPLRLSIGAPSSPLISNFVMYHFDSIIAKICESLRINYSRYADDITFSTNVKNVLFDVPKLIEKTLKSEGYKNIHINREKTVFTSKGHNRHVTGITISNDGELTIGRCKKRFLSAAIHKFSSGKMEGNEIETLKGNASFAFFIEPEFRVRMEKKYGADTLEHLFKSHY